MPDFDNESINFFLKQSGLKFKKIKFLHNALIHSSYSNEYIKEKIENNERMEFFGDTVLSMIISEYLYNIQARRFNDAIGNKFEKLNEADMSLIRSQIISRENLGTYALTLGLDKCVLVGGSYKDRNSLNKKILADIFESVICAIYLDAGYEKTFKLIIKIFDNQIKKIARKDIEKNEKQTLQEFALSKYKQLPDYKTVKVEGPEHNPEYTVNLKEAQRTAAGAALIKLLKKEI